MSEEQRKSNNDMLKILIEYVRRVADYEYLFHDNIMRSQPQGYCNPVLNKLGRNGFPMFSIEGHAFVNEALRVGFQTYIKGAENAEKAKGRLLFKFMDEMFSDNDVAFDEKKKFPKNKHKNDDYYSLRHFQSFMEKCDEMEQTAKDRVVEAKEQGVSLSIKNGGYYDYRDAYRKRLVYFLNLMGLNYTAKNRINALEEMNYRFSDDDHQRLYDHLGTCDLGRCPEELEDERKQSVNLFHRILKRMSENGTKDGLGDAKKCRKTIIAAKAFLETVARNAPLLKDAKFVDEKGALGAKGLVYEIDKEARQKMAKAITKSKQSVSPECANYLAGIDSTQTPMDVHLNALYTTLNQNRDLNQRRVLLKNSLPLINFYAEREENVSRGFVERYLRYLEHYTAYNTDDQEVGTEVLEKLLQKRTNKYNEEAKKETLFEEYASSKDVVSMDKSCVIAIAKQYSANFKKEKSIPEVYNPYFHKKMTEMFGRIVKKHHYKRDDVRNLHFVLSRNPDEAMKKMAKDVMAVYTGKGSNGGKGGNDGH